MFELLDLVQEPIVCSGEELMPSERVVRDDANINILESVQS